MTAGEGRRKKQHNKQKISSIMGVHENSNITSGIKRQVHLCVVLCSYL